MPVRYASMEHWYEALRVLVTSWEEAEDAVAMFLDMAGERQCQRWPPEVRAVHSGFWQRIPDSFPRLEHLKDILLYKHDMLTASHGEFRGILFVQQRIVTHILEHFILNDQDLNHLFRPACIYASSSPATPSLSISAKDSEQRLRAFSVGSVNLLVATVVAEEGMDVPAANCVIRFDPMVNSVSFVQGRGRARQAESAYVVLAERSDRPTSALAAAEQQQLEMIRTFEVPAAADPGQEVSAQRARERNAKEVLFGSLAASEALQVLNLFCKKTKASGVQGAMRILDIIGLGQIK